MVVWQGVTSDGTATPVQVTDEGKVIAIGQEGPAGPPGADGQDGQDSQVPGPPGPPGADGVQWPPNAFEGAFLMYLDGVVQWATPEDPIIPPQEWIGPITGLDGGGSVLLFEGNLDPNQFLQGTEVIGVDQYGQDLVRPGQINGDFLSTANQSIFTPHGEVNGSMEDIFTAGNTNFMEVKAGYHGASSTQGFEITNLKWEGLGAGTLAVIGQSAGTVGAWYSSKPGWRWGGRLHYFWNDSATGSWTMTLQSDATDVMDFMCYGACDGYEKPNDFKVTGISLNGQQLVDGPAARGTVSQVVNNALVLRENNGGWQVGDYVKTTDVAYATWLAASRGYSVKDLKNLKSQ